MYCPECGANAFKKSTDPYWHCIRCGPQFVLTMPSPCADVVAVHRGRVLLIERAREPDKGGWAFPGGHLEPFENPMSGAIREFEEETGLCLTYSGDTYLEMVDLLGVYMDGNNLVACYYYEIGGEEPELMPNSDEVSGYRWVDYWDENPIEHLAPWRDDPIEAALHLWSSRWELEYR